MRTLILFNIIFLLQRTVTSNQKLSEWEGYLNVSAGIANIYSTDTPVPYFVNLSPSNFNFLLPESLNQIPNALLNKSIWETADFTFQLVKTKLEQSFLSFCVNTNKTIIPENKYFRFNRYIGTPTKPLVLNTAALFEESNTKKRLEELEISINITIKLHHIMIQEQHLIQRRLENDFMNYFNFQAYILTDFLKHLLLDDALTPEILTVFPLSNINLLAVKSKISSCTTNVFNLEIQAVYGKNPESFEIFHYKSAGYFLNETFVKPLLYEYYVIVNKTMQAIELSECFRETNDIYHCPVNALCDNGCTPENTSTCSVIESPLTENYIDAAELENYIQISSVFTSFKIFRHNNTTSFTMPENGQVIVLLNKHDQLQIGYRMFDGKSSLPTKVYFRKSLKKNAAFTKMSILPKKSDDEDTLKQNENSNMVQEPLSRNLITIYFIILLMVVTILVLVLWFTYLRKFFHPL